MPAKRSIVWFRQDLRLHDNEALQEALKHTEEIIPVFIFDERVFKGKTRFGFPKTGKYRSRFIIESVADLRESLRELQSDLIVRVGKPEEIIFDLAQKVKSSWVFCNRERTRDEVMVQDALEKKLWTIGQEMRFSRGKMLYYTADLPFPVTHTPDVFTHFRKEVERFIPVREPLPTPGRPFKALSVAIKPGDIPTLEDFGFEDFETDRRAAFPFRGGEKEALKRLRYFLWESQAIRTYKDTRNELIGEDFSSKFSPFLAQGCLSPKKIYAELKRFEREVTKNKSTYWLFFELMWRDFFRLMGKKHESKIFLKGGIIGKEKPELKNDRELLEKWIEGRTGVPFVDANMREIAETGYMSNRGRQNVASFLINDLKVNWQMGADYFESMLIDYDPCSNWGNWNYIAGLAGDSKEAHYFNIISQAKRYDPQGAYVKLWLPELADLPSEKVHQPDILSDKEQKIHHFQIGFDYPHALVSTRKWAG